jgi:hypothetical protein
MRQGLTLPLVAVALLTILAVPGTQAGGARAGIPTSIVCITDDQTKTALVFNQSNGQYTLCLRSGGTINGTGQVKSVSGIIMLTDSKPDRRVSAGFNAGSLTGAGTFMFQSSKQSSWQTFRLNQTVPHAQCGCK